MERGAIGIVRVSQTAGREGESFRSPTDQRERIEEACKRDGLTLIETHEELDVSGGTPLAKRVGLSLAVEAIERGEAEVVMVAYFDRLFRSLRVQEEVVSRVEAVGGRVVTLDFGDVTGATAAQWLSGTMIGAVSEYYRRSARERNRAAQAKAVAAGIPPFTNIPPGYVKGPDKRLVVDPDIAPLVVGAFEMRANRSPIRPIRDYLLEHGVKRSHHGVESMLGQKLYLGEIHFGKLVNLNAHEPIVERELFATVQRLRSLRGRRPKSDRLLSRLGILRCGTCGARMSVGTQRQNGRNYPFYKCNPLGDCPQRMAISARIVEEAVVERVKELLVDVEGRASAEEHVQVAERAVDSAQADLDAAVRAFEGIKGESAAIERIEELRLVRDKAEAHLDSLGGRQVAVVITAHDNWGDLTSDERRALVRATIETVTIAPGRGAGRISIHAFGDDPASV